MEPSGGGGCPKITSLSLGKHPASILYVYGMQLAVGMVLLMGGVLP